MFGPLGVYLIAVFLNAVDLFMQVFFTIMYSDLEVDYINPIDLCNRLNRAGLQAFLTFLFLIRGFWFSFLINAPLFAYNAHKFYSNNHLLDATEIFRTLSKHKLESIFKLGFYMVLFFLYLYLMITVIVAD